jgi:colicin import membrane protein
MVNQDKAKRITSLGSIPVVASLLGVLAIGVVLYLMLTTAVNERAFELRDLQDEAKVLEYKITALESQLAELNSATGLANQAQALGMKPNTSPAQLRLSDGKVLGKAAAVKGDEMPLLKYKTDDQRTERRKQLDAAEKKKQQEAAKQAAEEAAKKAEAKAAKQAAEEAAKAAAEAQAQADAAAAEAAAAQAAAEAAAQDPAVVTNGG